MSANPVAVPIPTPAPEAEVAARTPDVAASPCAAQPRRKKSLKKTLNTLWKRIGYGVDLAAPTVLPIFANRQPAKQVHSAGRTVSLYRHFPDDPKLLADWDALSRDLPGAVVFQSPHWHRGLTIGADALGTLRLITVHQGQQLKGVLTLEKKWGNRWRTPGLLTTAYHDPLVDPDGAEETWQAIMQALPQLGMNAMTMQLLSPRWSCRDVFPRTATSAGFTVQDTVADTGTTIPLGAAWDDYLKHLDKKHRKELIRKMKKAAEQGGARFVVHAEEQAVLNALPEVFTMMEKAGGVKGSKTKLLYRRHYRLAGPELARTGRCAVYQLYIGDVLGAGLIALPQQNYQLLWGCAFNAEVQQWSPGIVLMGHIFQHAIEQGQMSIDLLRGAFAYKYQLGAEDHELHRITISR